MLQAANFKAIESAILELMDDEDGPKLVAELEKRLKPVPKYVEYVAIGGKRQPSELMQPKVRRVYQALETKGPMNLPALQKEMGDDFPRNTIRYAIQILRQAGMVKSERPE